ncbi:uncharacterized protein LOC142974105 isoform X2 [Anticarsia gemmatalis]|uniref:uncharacterized protein LOC142974105 isoform X2 n=1 Tax=Anticarsia gemmatalis TaxID=129554 RepID=UPI003F76835A
MLCYFIKSTYFAIYYHYVLSDSSRADVVTRVTSDVAAVDEVDEVDDVNTGRQWHQPQLYAAPHAPAVTAHRAQHSLTAGAATTASTAGTLLGASAATYSHDLTYDTSNQSATSHIDGRRYWPFLRRQEAVGVVIWFPGAPTPSTKAAAVESGWGDLVKTTTSTTTRASGSGGKTGTQEAGGKTGTQEAGGTTEGRTRSAFTTRRRPRTKTRTYTTVYVRTPRAKLYYEPYWIRGEWQFRKTGTPTTKVPPKKGPGEY